MFTIAIYIYILESSGALRAPSILTKRDQQEQSSSSSSSSIVATNIAVVVEAEVIVEVPQTALAEGVLIS